MKIKMNLDQTSNGFELDTTAIKLQSIDRRNVKLPYAGQLPEGISADSAHITFHMMPTQAKAVLVCKDAGKSKRFVLEYTADEVKAILNRFFFAADGGPRMDNGMDLYWLGMWTAHYIDWTRTEA